MGRTQRRMQMTSLEAFSAIQPELSTTQSLVYNVIKMYPGHSNRDYANMMDKPINTVTPRVKELRDRCLVVHAGYKTDILTKKRVMTWRTL